MEKRKLKLNILDVTIVVVVICAVVALIFRETITDAFKQPEIVVLEVTVSSDIGGEKAKTIFSVGNIVSIDGDNQLQAVVSTSAVASSTSKAVLNCNGYEKLGRYYTENGDLISIGDAVAVTFGDIRLDCRLQSVEMAG